MTNWNELRVRYVSGSMSLKQLAKEHGVSYSQVSKHASQEHWREQRKQFGKNVANDFLDSARARAHADLECALQATSGLVKVAAEALKDKDQFRRYLVTRSDGEFTETVEEVFQKVDTRAIRELTEALNKLTAMLREFYNEPTEEERLHREGMKANNQKTRAQIRQMKEENQVGGQSMVVRFETSDEYYTRTGNTETERETESLSE